jgi:tRNA-dihydrouridine synthase
MATCRATWISTRPSIRWPCSWAAASRPTWRKCAKLGEQWGYDEINLNCGCPSERVQRGAFGACLMAEPQLVADCVKAMVDAVDVPVTVKHRIGIDKVESYEFVRDFVGTVSRSGLRRVHGPCAQCLAEGPVAQGEPRGAAAALRDWCTGSSASSRTS